MSLMTIQTLFCFSETIVSEYKTFDVTFNIEADFDKNNNLTVYVSIYAGDEYVKYLGFDNESEVIKFRNTLMEILSKYKEYTAIAKSNNVKEYRKDLSLPINYTDLVWKSYAKGDYYFAFNVNLVTNFYVDENGETSIQIYKIDVPSSVNKYITTNAFLAFKKTEEIQSLYDALDLDQIKNKLNSKTNVDDLFN